MGDSANIVIKNFSDKVILYTHWRGSEIEQIAHNGMMRGLDTWDDVAYLSRVIFCEMLKNEDPEDTCGLGISSTIIDGKDNVLIINVEKQVVDYNDKHWTFVEFIG